MRLSRRRALQLTAATAVVAAAGGYALTRRPEDLVKAILERHFGPVDMPEADLAAFTRASLVRHPWIAPPWKLSAAYSAAYDLGAEAEALRVLPDERAAALERFERHILGDALRMTDIGLRPEGSREATFLGASACMNPFARFDSA